MGSLVIWALLVQPDVVLCWLWLIAKVDELGCFKACLKGIDTMLWLHIVLSRLLAPLQSRHVSVHMLVAPAG